MWTLCPADGVINDRPSTGHRRLAGRRGMTECPSSLGRRATPAVFPADVRVLRMPTSPGPVAAGNRGNRTPRSPVGRVGLEKQEGNQPYIIHGRCKSEGASSYIGFFLHLVLRSYTTTSMSKVSCLPISV